LRRCSLARTEAGADSGIIAGIAANICLFHLAAIQDYAPAAARDIQTNGLPCSLKG